AALAVESCCDTTIEARPSKPPGRRRSGSGPASACAAAKRLSAAIRRAVAAARSASVWMKWDIGGKASTTPVARNQASAARLRSMSRPIFRFAPSPNGYLHLGHALSALLNADMARRADGRLLLRIEDIDRTRCRPEYEAAIYQDLAWLGIGWEEPVRRQSAHFDDYRAALARLDGLGLLYPSFESRSEIAALVAAREAQAPWPRDPDGAPLYPGDARSLS